MCAVALSPSVGLGWRFGGQFPFLALDSSTHISVRFRAKEAARTDCVMLVGGGTRRVDEGTLVYLLEINYCKYCECTFTSDNAHLA